MTAHNAPCNRGDRFRAYGDSRTPHFIEVTRMARDGSWADIRVYTWAVTWAKRMPISGIRNLLDAKVFARAEWTHDDILATVPK